MNLSKKFHKNYQRRGRYFRLNYNIVAPTVRVLDEAGKQVGIFSKDEALRRARMAGVDLVEIAPLAVPPVCKIIDFKKFRYLESKKERESKKKTKNVELKQIMLSPFIGEHDYLTKLNQAREFLTEGNRLKIMVRFKGRQFTKKEFGFDIINRLILNLEGLAVVDRPPHFEGKMLIAQVTASKKKKGNDEAKNEKLTVEKVQVNQKGEVNAKKTELKTFKKQQDTKAA